MMEESGLLGDSPAAKQAEEAMQRLAAEGKTPLLFARDGKLAGIIAVADTIRETSRAAIRRFGEMGLHAVSYTHLDVYKRQPISSVRGTGPSSC